MHVFKIMFWGNSPGALFSTKTQNLQSLWYLSLKRKPEVRLTSSSLSWMEIGCGKMWIKIMKSHENWWLYKSGGSCRIFWFSASGIEIARVALTWQLLSQVWSSYANHGVRLMYLWAILNGLTPFLHIFAADLPRSALHLLRNCSLIGFFASLTYVLLISGHLFLCVLSVLCTQLFVGWADDTVAI